MAEVNASSVTPALPRDRCQTSVPRTSSGKAVGRVGVSLILLAIICNHWVLAYCFSTDGVIEETNRLLVWIFELVMAGVGLLLVGFRRRVPVLALVVTPLLILVSLFLVEVFLRATEPRPLAIARENPNGTGSYRLKPNLDLPYRQGGKCIRIKTNSHGMRWREVSVAKRAGKRRVAFLGDSFTFGMAADSVEKGFVGVFDSQIDRSKYEVLNFGMPGYGFGDVRLQLEEQVFAFQPDYVILVSFNGNDLRDTYLGANKYKLASGVIEMNWVSFREKVPTPYRPEREDPIAGRAPCVPEGIRLVHLFRKFLLHAKAHGFKLPTRTPVEDEECLGVEFVVANEFTYPTFWNAQRYPEVASDARDMSLGELSRIRALCEGHGARFFLVTIPTKEQVYAESPAGIDPNGVAYDITFPQRYVETWAEENRVPYLDLLPTLRQRGLEDGVCLCPGGSEVHLNNVGHEIAGRRILEFFRLAAEDQTWSGSPQQVAQPLPSP